jgi:hypothetical protein
MVVRARAFSNPKLAGQWRRIHQWVEARRVLIAAVASVLSGILTALYGTAGRVEFL